MGPALYCAVFTLVLASIEASTTIHFGHEVFDRKTTFEPVMDIAYVTDPNMPIPVHGRLTGWRAYLRDDGVDNLSPQIRFQVWRPVKTTSDSDSATPSSAGGGRTTISPDSLTKFRLIGQTPFYNVTFIGERYFPVSDPVDVMAGDFIGMQYHNSNPLTFRQNSDDNSTLFSSCTRTASIYYRYTSSMDANYTRVLANMNVSQVYAFKAFQLYSYYSNSLICNIFSYQADIEVEREAPVCEQLVAKPQPSDLTSENYPRPFNSPTDKCWKIITQNPQEVIQFEIVDVNFLGDCAQGYLDIWNGDGISDTGYRMVDICGGDEAVKKSVLTSEMPHVSIRFYSMGDIPNLRGFHIRFSAVMRSSACQELYGIPDKEQTLTFPEDGEDYMPVEHLCWNIISSDPTKHIIITIDDLDIEQSNDCVNDFLEIKDDYPKMPKLVGRWCGKVDSVQPRNFMGKGSSFTVRFASDEYRQGRGFKIVYKVYTPEVTCTPLKAVSKKNNKISTGYPTGYPSNQAQCWEITSDVEGKIVAVNFTDFDLEHSQFCTSDFVEIFDGALPTGESFRTTTVASVWGWATGASGPSGPSGGTGPDSAGHSAFGKGSPEPRELTTTTTHPARGSPAPGYMKLGSWCGNTSPGLVESYSKKLFIKFISDADYSGRGFKFEYFATSPGARCTKLKAELLAQYLLSTGFPHGYLPNADECWVIDAPRGFVVVLRAIKIEMAYSYGCRQDGLEIRDGDSIFSPLIAAWCGFIFTPADEQQELISTTSALYISFRSVNSKDSGGFKLLFNSYEPERPPPPAPRPPPPTKRPLPNWPPPTQRPEPTRPPPRPRKDDDTLPFWAIALIVLAAIVLLLLIVSITVQIGLLSKKKSSRYGGTVTMSGLQDEQPIVVGVAEGNDNLAYENVLQKHAD